MVEKRIICVQCGNPFVFPAQEQERFNALGFDEPKRCRECRKRKVKDGPSRLEAKMKNKRRQARHQWEYVSDEDNTY